VLRNPGLAPYEHMISHRNRARNADLGGNQTPGTKVHIVRNLNQIVDFGEGANPRVG
jgi:hypothetical protein